MKGPKGKTVKKGKPATRRLKPKAPLSYKLYRLAHVLLFNDKSIVFKMFRPIARYIDARHRLKKVSHYFEHQAKVALFGCMDCGDCALVDVAYICPMSQCPKYQRNGPCGGSKDDWCEGYPNEMKCIWVKAYQRLQAYHEEDKIRTNIVPPCDWTLWQTPSWLNFYLGRDHVAKKLGIKPEK